MTIEQIIRIGTAAGALSSLGAFLLAVYRKGVKPIVAKLATLIDEERRFRDDLHDMLRWQRNVEAAAEEILSLIHEVREMLEWYQKLKGYVDFNVAPKAKRAAAGAAPASSDNEPNGGVQ